MAFLLTGYIMDARYGFSKLLDEKAYSGYLRIGLGFTRELLPPVARNLPVTGFSSGRVWLRRDAPPWLISSKISVQDFIFLPQFRALQIGRQAWK